MKQVLMTAILFLLISSLPGCGKNDPKLIRAKGKLLIGSNVFEPEGDEVLQVYFVPIAENGSPPRNWYAAEVNQELGTFYARGGHDQGMPPGKYRVGVEIKRKKKDILEGKFNAINSPFIFDVDEDSEVMIIDLENPPAKS